MAEKTQELIEELEPLDGGVVDPDEALDISDAALLEGDADATLLISPPPQTLGQTMAWDFETHERRGADSSGPHMVRGDAALIQWIDKCLRTHAGAHPIHPEGYGMEVPITALIGRTRGDVELSELEGMIKEALTFHPAVMDVTNFESIWRDEDTTGDAGLEINFRVVRDNETTLKVGTAISSGGVITGAVA